MNVEFTPRDAPELPRELQVQIDGVVRGRCTPRIYSDDMAWHAVIPLDDRRLLATCLLQGHGASPREAVGRAILAARAELLADLEVKLGTAGLSAQEVLES